jgi:hypothetical protein
MGDDGARGPKQPAGDSSVPEHKRRRRNRHRHGPRRDPLAPVTRPRRLNLDLPVTEPLAPEEQREMCEHLAFLRQFKPHLGLSLNANEDLLVNGALPPTDRGVCKHLLSKLDRRAVERALGREAVKTDAAVRARLLAGVARITPDVGTLLAYLEALTWVSDKHDAAAAFGATIDRIDFAAVSATQMAALLDVINKTFDGHERVQALFGLLASKSFAQALGRTLTALPSGVRDAFAPLSAAYRAVVLGASPGDAEERALAERGVSMWLEAPDRILRGYPVETRQRLVRYALGAPDVSAVAKPARILVDSLPRGDTQSAELGIALFDRLLAGKHDDLARGLLNILAQAHPKLARVTRRQAALSWPRLGRLAMTPDPHPAGRLRRAFSLDLPGFVWARTAGRDHAARLAAEAEIQAELLAPGVAPCLGHGTAPDGTAYVVIAAGGRPVDQGLVRRATLGEALAMALQGVRILHAVASAGAQIPDASIERFVSDRAAASLRLADMDGATRAPQDACRARLADLAAAFCRQILAAPDRQGLRPDVPTELAAALGGQTEPGRVARLLAMHAARSWDRDAPEPADGGESQPGSPDDRR